MAHPLFPMLRPVIALWFGFAILGSAAAAEPAASPVPSPTPGPEETFAVAVFEAIADGDVERLRLALNDGGNPEAELPHTAAADALRARYHDEELAYYLRLETGYTPLMFAAAIGNEPAVRLLLAAGADPHRESRKNQTFALWQAARAGHLRIMCILMGIQPGSEPTRYRVRVDLASQRATVWKDETVLLTSPVCSGKESTPTPPGRYLITNKYRQWKSTIYPARMPFFLRLSCRDFGLHAGPQMGYPASHGCVRLPEKTAKELFALLPVGTLVEIR
ncbi:MAG TPA: L,D-transpeptidase family protein [Chthoniobacterales bacterium]